MPTGSTVLIIKSPKTISSIRRVYLPTAVANMLKEHKANQDEIKEYLGSEYFDYNLVIASSDGRPVEGQVVNRGFSKLIKGNNLPKVVFHSLRHTSVIQAKDEWWRYKGCAGRYRAFSNQYGYRCLFPYY